MPMAMLLAVVMIIGLFGVATIIAPDLVPALQSNGEHPAAVAGPSSTSLAPTPGPLTSPTPSPKATPSRRASSRPATVSSKVLTWEDDVLRLVNVERGKAGCQALRMDSHLRRAARDFSALMAAKNFFDHVSPDGSTFVDRIARAGYPRGQAAAENIAYGYRDPAAVMKGWMGSEGHRRNILNCSLKAIGVGLAYRKSTPYWTQDFGRQ